MNIEVEIKAKIACIKFLEDLGIKDVERNQIKMGYPQIYWEKNSREY